MEGSVSNTFIVLKPPSNRGVLVLRSTDGGFLLESVRREETFLPGALRGYDVGTFNKAAESNVTSYFIIVTSC